MLLRSQKLLELPRLVCPLDIVVSTDMLTFDKDIGNRSLSCHVQKSRLNVSPIVHIIQFEDDGSVNLEATKQVFGFRAVGTVTFAKNDNLVLFNFSLCKVAGNRHAQR